MTGDFGGASSAATVAVLGAGSWGTTFAKILADAADASGVDREIRLWGRRAEVVDQINLKHRNEQYLRDITLPPRIAASTDVAEVLAGAELVVLAVPAQTLRPQLREWAVLDTFDMYSPEYDNPQPITAVAAMFARSGARVTFAGHVDTGSGRAAVVRAVRTAAA